MFDLYGHRITLKSAKFPAIVAPLQRADGIYTGFNEPREKSKSLEA